MERIKRMDGKQKRKMNIDSFFLILLSMKDLFWREMEMSNDFVLDFTFDLSPETFNLLLLHASSQKWGTIEVEIIDQKDYISCID